PRVREHALRMAEHFRDNPNVLAQLEKMTEDAVVGVRYQLAFSLGAFPSETAVRSLVKLAQRDGTDSWFRLAILSSVNGRQGEVFRRLIGRKEFRTAAHGQTMLTDLAVQVGAGGRRDAL